MNTLLTVAGAALGVGALFMISRRSGDMTREDAHKLVAEGATLLDVRSGAEYAAGHVAQARNIPLQDLPRRLNDAGARETPIVVYCLSGHRSAQAKRFLVASGFTQVHDLGAMSRW